jgi:hypothetical protein
MTMFDGRTKLAEQVVEEVRSYFGPRVYESVIPRSIRLAEAPGFGQPITRYDPSSRGARAYQALAQELLTRPSGEGLDDEALEAISQGPPIVVSPERTEEPKEAVVAQAPVRRKKAPTDPVETLDPAVRPERAAPDAPSPSESDVVTNGQDREPEVPDLVEPDEGPKRRRRWPFGKGGQP